MHSLVRTAIDAWQRGDSRAWLACFATHAVLFDDGAPRDFGRFSSEALGHERFTHIDSSSEFEVVGDFHSEQWGDFKTYFRFHLSPAGVFDRLDIGQV